MIFYIRVGNFTPRYKNAYLGVKLMLRNLIWAQNFIPGNRPIQNGFERKEKLSTVPTIIWLQPVEGSEMVGPVVKVFRRQNVNTPLSRVMA
jgi:hypothetical protein